MAIGLARMFSIRFPMNFDSPFKAENILDFWQRWHMTLTRYIMAYLYAPMQMRVSRWRLDHGRKVSRKAQATPGGLFQMVLLPTFITLFLAGLWHGAGLQFVLYGLMHGTFICCNHVWRAFLPERSMLRRAVTRPVAVVVTFIAVTITFVMFRANSAGDALRVYAGLLGRHGRGAAVPAGEVALLAGLCAVVWLMPNTQEILGEAQREDEPNWSVMPRLRWRTSPVWWAATAVAFAFCMAYSSAKSTFLYFQF